MICPNLYRLVLRVGGRKYKCCRLKGGVMLRDWRCRPGSERYCHDCTRATIGGRTMEAAMKARE